MLRRFLNKYFDVTPTEVKGIWFLLFIIIILISLNITWPHLAHYFYTQSNQTNQHLPDFINALENEQMEAAETSAGIVNNTDENTIKAFTFNPNEVTHQQLTEMGLTAFQANNLVKYRNKGGYFYKKNDLLRIYGIDSIIYQQLKAYIVFDKAERNIFEADSIYRSQVKYLSPEKSDINQANETDLTQISGIGKKRASTIIKYRDLLGGFARLEQLNEVYGLPDSLVHEISNQFTADTTRLRAIHLNSISYSKLLRHPYINKYQVSAIFKYKKATGSIQNLRELTENNIIDSITASQLRPYLQFN